MKNTRLSNFTNFNKICTSLSLSLSLSLVMTLFCQSKLTAQPVFTAKRINYPGELKPELGLAKNEKLSTFSLDLAALNTYLQSNLQKENIELALVFGEGQRWDLTLEPNDLRGLPGRPLYKCHAYKGIANQSAENRVRLYVHEDYIGGYVTSGDARYFFNTLRKQREADKSIPFTIAEMPYNRIKHDWQDEVENTTDGCEEKIVNVELGVYVDYQAYLAHNENEQDIIMHIENLFNVVQGFYLDETDWTINIVVRGTIDGEPVIWTEPDDFCCPRTAILGNKLNNHWILHRPCIPQDGIFLFSGNPLYTGAGSTAGSFCNNPDYSPTSQINPFIPTNGNETNVAEAFVFAHEFGHLLGLRHIESFCSSQSAFCGFPCPNSSQSALMCGAGTCPRDISIAFLDMCSADYLETFFPEECDGCLGDIRPIPLCENCLEYGSGLITADNTSPIIGCEGQDIVNYTVTVCNSCDAQSLDVEAAFNSTSTITELLEFDPNEWPILETGPNTSRLKNNEVWFEGEECKDFHFSLRIIGNTTTGAISATVKSNGNTVGEVDIYPFEETLGNQNGESLEALIENNTLWHAPVSCDWAPNVTDKRRFFISGTLNVDVPYCMDSYDLVWEPGAQIIVESGVKLTIKNSHIKGCDGMGKGILVEDGATLIVEHSTIEDAQYAIHAYGDCNISVTNSTFNRNFVGIYVDGPIPTYSGAATFDQFFGNTFDGQDGLLPPYSGQTSHPATALEDKAFAGVWVQTKANTLHSLDNVFKNMSNGIYANQTNLKLTKNQFTEIRENGYQDYESGYGLRAFGTAHTLQVTGFGKNGEITTFSSGSKAIRVEGMSVDYIRDNIIRAEKGIELVNCFPKANVWNNKIVAYGNGIELHQIHPATNLYVDFNDIEVETGGGIGIQLNMAGIAPANNTSKNISGNEIYLKATKTRGIESNAGNALKVVGNKIFGNETNGYSGIAVNSDYNSDIRCNEIASNQLITAATGIRVWDGEVSHFNCNEVKNTGLGISFAMGSMSPENVRENYFNNNGTGLYVAASAALGAQTHTGNQWAGTFANYGAENGGSSAPAFQQSQFTVHQATPGTYRPTLPSGQQSWFDVDDLGSPSDDCDNITACLITVPPDSPNDDGLSGLDGDIATGAFTTTAYDTQMVRLARRYLFRKLKRYPELATPNSDFEDFLIAENGTSVKAYYSIENGIGEMYEIAGTTKGEIDTGFIDLAMQMEAIGMLDSLLAESESDSLLLAVRDSVIGITASQTLVLDSVLEEILDQRIYYASSVAGQNASIVNESLLDENERTVNNIFLNTVAKDILAFDSLQLDSLGYIANQCPLRGGTAVFRARSLLALVSDEDYDDDELCEDAEEREESQRPGDSRFAFYLFPNPAKESFTLVIPNYLDGGLNMTLINQLGVPVLQRALQTGKSSLTFSTANFHSGIYTVAVSQNGIQVFSEKLIIIQ